MGFLLWAGLVWVRSFSVSKFFEDLGDEMWVYMER